MDIKVLGTGCSRCNSLEKVTVKAIEALQLNATLTKVDDIQEIMKFSVMRTPALVINEKVVLTGQVPDIEAMIELLTSNL